MISALNKYWRPLPNDEFWNGMDMIDTNNAVSVSSMPKEIREWVWETKRNLGDMF